jgi:uncharacterized protein (DUF58 family)
MKYLKKDSKILLTLVFLFMLIFGKLFYILFALLIIYILLYGRAIGSVKYSFFSDVSTYTLTLNDFFDFFYRIEAKTFLPVKYRYEILFPFYIVETAIARRPPVFGRTIKVYSASKCRANRRGTYELGHCYLYVVDPLNLFTYSIKMSDKKKIFVFPYLVSIEKLPIRLTDPFEGKKAKYRINFDYSYVAGVRDYTPEDALSSIHWKQTAHRGKLQVKEFDFSASKKIYAVLNYFNKSIKFQDYASSIASSIIYYANKFHLPFGVLINATPVLFLKARSGDFHMFQNFKALSEDIEGSIESSLFIKMIPNYVEFGSEVFFIDREVDINDLETLMKINHYFSKLNVVLLVDETFVLPDEKPPNYFFVEPESVMKILNLKETLEKEHIFVYPIFGNDYLSILEV